MIEEHHRTLADQAIAALDAVAHQCTPASVRTCALVPLGSRVLSQARDIDNVAFECFGVLRHVRVGATEMPRMPRECAEVRLMAGRTALLLGRPGYRPVGPAGGTR